MDNQEVNKIKRCLAFYLSLEYRAKQLQYELDHFSENYYKNNSLIGTAQLYTELDLYQRSQPVEYAALKIVSNENALKRKIERLTSLNSRFKEALPVEPNVLRRLVKRRCITNFEVEAFQLIEDLEEQLEEERMLKRQKQIRERAKIAFK